MMPGKLADSWPDWPEFSDKNAETGDDLREYKRQIVEEYGEEALTQSWLKTCKALESITDDIAASGTDYIPEVAFEDLFSLPSAEKQRLKDIGCFKVKQAVPKGLADQWFRDLKSFVAQNRDSICGKSNVQTQRSPSEVL